MYSFLTKNGQTFAFVIGVVLSMISIILIMGNPSTLDLTADTFTGKSPADLGEALDKLTQFDFGLYVTYILCILAPFITLAFGLYQFVRLLIDSPKKAITSAILIGGIIVLFFIGKVMAPSVDSKGVMAASAEFAVTDGQRNLISASINATGIMLVIAIVALVLGEIRNVFK
jgi:hypothetical protein